MVQDSKLLVRTVGGRLLALPFKVFHGRMNTIFRRETSSRRGTQQDDD
ncbi:hypothetical protein AWB74_07313 [Caballeronia arvi]|uniref:Uncharacterized protein n=1 Tax=Caballeronia arvi TaxID=1777135 RepID=A0A158KWC2_9BURK|nr:hypothetical protein AWB74_07313 [Caballeronia arvi]